VLSERFYWCLLLLLLYGPRVKEFALSEFKEALSFAQSGHRTQKAVFVPNKQ